MGEALTKSYTPYAFSQILVLEIFKILEGSARENGPKNPTLVLVVREILESTIEKNQFCKIYYN